MRLAPFALITVLALAACERDVYTVRMQASDAGFERRLEVVRLDANGARKQPPAEVLDPIRAIYGSRGDAPLFEEAFETATPADIGGRGSLSRAATSLGTTYVYMERFRGDDDLTVRLNRIESAASAGAALFLGWLDAALAGEPAWPAFRATLADGRLDRDFRNMALLVWLDKNSGRVGAPRPDSSDDDALLVRLAAYLVDQGYLTAEQLPLGPSLMDEDGPGRLLAAWLAREMNLGERRLPAAFADPESLGASWETYLHSPPSLQVLEAWAAEAGIPKPTEEPVTDSYFSDLTTIATGSEPSDAGAEDEIHLALACPVEPLTTNGEWSADEHAIKWWFNVEPSPETAYLVPAVAFAAWAEPDETYQTARFGSVILTGEPLSAYCAWHARLGEAARDDWDKFLESLSAQTDPRAALNSYKPAADPAWATEQNGRKLLLDALAE